MKFSNLLPSFANFTAQVPFQAGSSIMTYTLPKLPYAYNVSTTSIASLQLGTISLLPSHKLAQAAFGELVNPICTIPVR